jgi:hypothetical protein
VAPQSGRPAKGVRVAIFMDIEFVSIQETEPPDAFTVAFDVIYAGETWCRSIVDVDTAEAARLGGEEHAVIRAARGALLDLLGPEPAPVSFHLRLEAEGPVVLAKARPGR